MKKETLFFYTQINRKTEEWLQIRL